MDQRVGRYTIHQARNLGHQHTYHMPSPFAGSSNISSTNINSLQNGKFASVPLDAFGMCHLKKPSFQSWFTPRSSRDTLGPKFGIKNLSPKNPSTKKHHDDKHPATPPSKESESGVATAKPLGYLQKRNLASVVVASEANPRLLARSNRKRTSWCCRLQDPQDHPREI